ncbi:41917_t:CDS:2, partial [Gigaspora margarita]
AGDHFQSDQKEKDLNLNRNDQRVILTKRARKVTNLIKKKEGAKNIIQNLEEKVSITKDNKHKLQEAEETSNTDIVKKSKGKESQVPQPEQMALNKK